jgi:hypothetical protein
VSADMKSCVKVCVEKQRVHRQDGGQGVEAPASVVQRPIKQDGERKRGGREDA